MPSQLEASLLHQFRALKITVPVVEHRFAAFHVGMGPGLRERLRKAELKDWRFDFAWPDRMFAVEVEGGNYTNGRHTRGKGFEEDCLKYHNAMALGWTVYRCDGKLVKSGQAAFLIERIIKN